MIKKLLYILICLIFLNQGVYAIDDSPIIVAYQEKVQKDLSEVLAKIIGYDNFVVSVRVRVKDEIKINQYIGKADNSKNAQNIKKNNKSMFEKDILEMPGVPNINEKTSGEVPYNSVSKTVSQKIDKVMVILTVNKKLPDSDIRKADNYIRRFLQLSDSRGDSLEVIKMDFVASGKQKEEKIDSGANAGQGSAGSSDQMKNLEDKLQTMAARQNESLAAMNLVSQMLKQQAKDGATPALQDLVKNLGQGNAAGATDKEKNTGKKQTLQSFIKDNLIYIIIAAVIFLLFIILIVILKSFNNKPAAPITMNSAPQSAPEPRMISRLDDEQLQPRAEHDRGADKDDKRERKYFDYVTEENVERLYHLLHCKIALNEATTKTVALVISKLDPVLRASLLLAFPIKIQAELLKILTEYEQFDVNEIEALDIEMRNSLTGLIGGQTVLISILDSISETSKKNIIDEIKKHYPAALKEMRDLVLLFEDIIELSDIELGMILENIDLEVIAKAVADNVEWQEVVTQVIPEGRRLMLQQTIEFSRGYTVHEKEDSKKIIMGYAKLLDSQEKIELRKRI